MQYVLSCLFDGDNLYAQLVRGNKSNTLLQTYLKRADSLAVSNVTVLPEIGANRGDHNAQNKKHQYCIGHAKNKPFKKAKKGLLRGRTLALD